MTFYTTTIESGVPIPTNWSAACRALAAAKIGDSFFIPKGQRIEAVRSRLSEIGPNWCTVRKVPGGYRAWKIAKPHSPLRRAA